MRKTLRTAVVILGLFTLLTGVAYPLLVTGLAQLFFPEKANGSLVKVGERTVGSALVGQPFTSPGYFWGRPSATPGGPYNAMASGGSNLGPANPALQAMVRERTERLRGSSPISEEPIPMDLVTASASGLDPHISPEAARWQVPRVAKASGIPESRLNELVDKSIQRPLPGIPGQPHVNVLLLNLEVENLEGRGNQ